MPPTDPTVPHLLGATAQMFVTDLPQSLSFFRDRLGFQTVFTHGDPPYYAEVRRDDARLNLRVVDQSPFVPGLVEREELLAAYVSVADPGSLLREVEAAGAVIHAPLRRTPWGTIEFIVRDPDGNLLLFGALDEDEPIPGRFGQEPRTAAHDL